MSDAADHIDHIRKVAGIDHIGLGGDFDGITSVPEGLEDVSKYPALTAELLRRGYTDEEIKKILGLNILRVMRRAESPEVVNATRYLASMASATSAAARQMTPLFVLGFQVSAAIRGRPCCSVDPMMRDIVRTVSTG